MAKPRERVMIAATPLSRKAIRLGAGAYDMSIIDYMNGPLIDLIDEDVYKILKQRRAKADLEDGK
jgi:hypothetical protein